MRKEIQKRIETTNQSKMIDLQDLEITDSELVEIIDNIKNLNTSLESILLNNNKITDIGASLLGKMLSDFQKLSFINLQFNFINLNGAENLFKLKVNLPNLEIALHGNLISNVAEMDNIEQKYIKLTRRNKLPQ